MFTDDHEKTSVLVCSVMALRSYRKTINRLLLCYPREVVREQFNYLQHFHEVFNLRIKNE